MRQERQRDGPTMEDFETEVLIPDVVTEARAQQEEKDPLERQKQKERIDGANRKRIREEKIFNMTRDF